MEPTAHTPTHAPTHLLHRGHAPLLISMPHLGRLIPLDLVPDYSPAALQLADTDWHLDRLYGMAQALGASVLQGRITRYVIDLNRPASGESLYPGQTTTGLCPTETFRGEPLYRDGRAPAAGELRRRVADYWEPYHAALRDELQRLRRQHGQVLLWEAHSIASVLPRLFEGKLPDLCFGTNDGASCAPALLQAALAPLPRHPGFSRVVNGRFKGGYNTRHYGVPDQGVHAIQLEMCQSLYMDEAAPFGYREDLAARVQPVLAEVLGAALGHLRAAPR